MILAHGVGSVYESPLPVSLYLVGAAGTVLVSFALRALAERTTETEPRRVAGSGAAQVFTSVARAFLLIAFLLIFVFAIVQPDPGLSVAPLLLWVVIVVLSVTVQAVVDNTWERANPWETITGFLGGRRGDTRTAPVWLGPLLLYALFWFELVSGEGFDPLAVAIAVLAYTLFVLSFKQVFVDDWDLVDPLSILFGFAGRSAPLELRDDGIYYKGPLADLDDPAPMPMSLFISVFVLLGSTTLDNVRETIEWTSFVQGVGLDALPDKLVDSFALLLFVLPFLLPFLGAVWAAQKWWHSRSTLITDARLLAWSMVPIGVAYLLAHNMPLLITGLPQLVSQIGSEFGADLFGRYIPSPQLVWFLEIALIVGGHVIGVLAAHRISVRLAPSHQAAVKSHTVLTLLMSAFTIVTLYLLSLPLVVQQA
jgi:hypothetical protein